MGGSNDNKGEECRDDKEGNEGKCYNSNNSPVYHGHPV